MDKLGDLLLMESLNLALHVNFTKDFERISIYLESWTGEFSELLIRFVSEVEFFSKIEWLENWIVDVKALAVAKI